MAAPKPDTIKRMGVNNLQSVLPTRKDETRKDEIRNPTNTYIRIYLRIILMPKSIKVRIPSNAFTLINTLISQIKEASDKMRHNE
jgi:hypothetical protein